MKESIIQSKKIDNELYQSFLRGNKESLNYLMIKYRKELTNFIRGYVKQLEIAEDIVQDTFMYIVINEYEYDFKYSFRTYLYTIAKSRALNYLKRRKRSILIEEDILDSLYIDCDIENDFIRKEDSKILVEALKKIPQKYQSIIFLYYFQEFKYKDISKILNQSMSKTKMSINRAKKALKKILKEDFEYDK